MKLICAGDLHIRANRPVSRKDDYYFAQFEKFGHLLDTAENFIREGEEVAILQPGDFFDTQVPYKVLADIGEMIGRRRDFGYHFPIFVVFGQHDMAYRNIRNTPLYVLDLLGVVQRAMHPSIIQTHSGEDVNIYGVDWGEDIPEPETEGFNVLLIHKMITKGGPLFPGQKDYEDAEVFLRKMVGMGYSLVVSGDNHQTFVVERKKGVLVNAGSMMRMSIDQADHKPCFFIFDTETREIEKRDFGWVFPAEEVFDFERQERKRAQVNFEFLDRIYSGKEVELGLDFQGELLRRAKDVGLEDLIKSILEEVSDE